MKTLIKLNYVVLFSILLFGCSIEDSVETIDENSFELEQKGKVVVSQFIEFYPGVPDSVRDAIRNQYKQDGILVSSTKCKDDKETWWVNCPGCKQGNPPIDKEDHPDEMRQAILYDQCKDD